MTTHEHVIVSLLGALSVSGFTGCATPSKSATEVPAATPADPSMQTEGECLHSEGCCGGHVEGDGSCGADKVASDRWTSPDAAAANGGPAGERRRFSWTVEPGKFAEINVELGRGANMSVTFESDSALSWNVHSHEGGEATLHAEGTDTHGTPTFRAEHAGLYSYLWANKSETPVRLTAELRIEGDGRVHSTHP